MTKEAKKQLRKKQFTTKWKYVLVMLPSLFLFTVFKIYPNLSVFPLSLYDWSPIRSTKEYVGFENFIKIFVINKDKTTMLITNTITYVLALFIIQTVFALILAIALQKNTKINTFFRAYFFLPKLFSAAMIGLTWQFMYDPNLGIINSILGALGVEGFPGEYLFKGNFISVLLVVIVHIWANLGYVILYILSGLSTISEELYEAAKMDGANGWQRFFSITLPLLVPTLSRISLLTLTTGILSADYTILLNGAANGQAATLGSYVYNQTRMGTDYGLVAALGVLMFVVLGTLSIIQFFGMRKIEKAVLE